MKLHRTKDHKDIFRDKKYTQIHRPYIEYANVLCICVVLDCMNMIDMVMDI